MKNVWVNKARCKAKLEQELGPQIQIEISKMSTNHRNNDKHTCASKFINTIMVQNVQALCGTQLGQVLGPHNHVRISNMSINHTNYDEYTCSSKYVYINMTDHTTHARPSCNK